jgi:hypothetical protein
MARRLVIGWIISKRTEFEYSTSVLFVKGGGYEIYGFLKVESKVDFGGVGGFP